VAHASLTVILLILGLVRNLSLFSGFIRQVEIFDLSELIRLRQVVVIAFFSSSVVHPSLSLYISIRWFILTWRHVILYIRTYMYIPFLLEGKRVFRDGGSFLILHHEGVINPPCTVYHILESKLKQHCIYQGQIGIYRYILL
jgi:hypothetical protein